MSAYTRDRRVRRRPDRRLEFTHAGVRYVVQHSGTYGWSVWRGDDFELVSQQHPSEDAAVASVLGAPLGVSVRVDG